MRARKALNLPRPKDLKSNSLEDIQNILRLLFEEIDSQWRLLFQDVSTIQVDSGGFIYFGGKDTLGTWRLGRIGADWVLQHQTTTVGTWVTVDTAKGS